MVHYCCNGNIFCSVLKQCVVLFYFQKDSLHHKYEEEKERNAELEEELVQLRKQLEMHAKPEAEQNGETDSWNDSDEDLFSSPGRYYGKHIVLYKGIFIF